MNKVGRANFRKTCAGTAMVELAIILPLLLLILFGITELGRALYQQNMLTQAVELGGRYMTRVEGAVNAEDCSEGDKWDVDFESAVENLIKCGVEAGCGDPILPNIVIDYIEVCGPGKTHASCASSPSACVITVKASAYFQSIFGADLVSLPGYRLGGITLNATTQERYIGH